MNNKAGHTTAEFGDIKPVFQPVDCTADGAFFSSPGHFEIEVCTSEANRQSPTDPLSHTNSKPKSFLKPMLIFLPIPLQLFPSPLLTINERPTHTQSVTNSIDPNSAGLHFSPSSPSPACRTFLRPWRFGPQHTTSLHPVHL